MDKNEKYSNMYNLKSISLLTKSIYESLTKSEQKVANIVFENPDKIIYGSITDLAEFVGVGDTTVLRYCRKIGFKGYYAFKLALAQEQTSKNENTSAIVSETIEKNDSIEDTIRKTINLNLLAIDETLKLLEPRQVEEAVEMLLGAKKIFLFGSGISSITAIDAMYKFLRIGLNVIAYSENHYQVMTASLLSKDDVAMAFSFSGSTKDTVDVMKIAKDAGANTICVTHHLKSPITNYSDIVLLMGSKEGPFEGGALETKISQLVVIDILYNCIHNRMTRKAREAKAKISQAITDKLY